MLTMDTQYLGIHLKVKVKSLYVVPVIIGHCDRIVSTLFLKVTMCAGGHYHQ